MRRIAIWMLATASAIALAFAWKTSTEVVLPAAPTQNAASTGSSSAPAAGSAPAAAPAQAPAAAPAPAVPDATYTGQTVNTRYGPVQVQIVVAGGQITQATATSYPSGNRENQQINGYAIPILQQETIGATSSNIAWVSGATYTSDGYTRSLQSALDQAGL